MKNKTWMKISLITLLIGITFIYGLYERNKFIKMDEENLSSPVLKTMPDFNLVSFPDSQPVSSNDFRGKYRGLFLHIWGSWCGPCEEEMPQFLKYARKIENEGVYFLLVAVNDSPEKVDKFMKRYGQLPKNLSIALDVNNKFMETFGTFKVPETFLFDSQSKNVNKFVGPQDWLAPSYVTRLNTWLGEKPVMMKPVETH